jgi:hypothetical protein
MSEGVNRRILSPVHACGLAERDLQNEKARRFATRHSPAIGRSVLRRKRATAPQSQKYI